MSNVYLTTTTLGTIRPEVAAYVANLASRGAIAEFPIYKPYENALNHAVCRFRESGCDYWINIDADNPPTCDVMPLCDDGKDYIGCPTPIFRKHAGGFVHWNVFKRTIDGYKPAIVSGSGLDRVDAVGTGCFIMHRRVAEKIPKIFERAIDSFGRVTTGVDLRACEIMHANGFEIWAAWDYPCHHFNTIDLLELV
jgi:hypothetical protein